MNIYTTLKYATDGYSPDVSSMTCGAAPRTLVSFVVVRLN